MNDRTWVALPPEWIREQRQARAWSQRRLREEVLKLASRQGHNVGLTKETVSRWENGHRQPDDLYRQLLVQLFGPPEQSPEGWDADVLRRDFLRTTAISGLAMLAPGLDNLGSEPWERLSAALEQPARVDAKTVAELERVTATCEQLYQQVAPASVVGPVQGHLQALTRLLEGGQPDALRKRLASNAAEVAGLAGWLAADMGRSNSAQAYYGTALRAAKEADDRALGAYLVGSLSTLPEFRERPREALHLLSNGADGVKPSHATPTTRSWLATLEAEAHVRANEHGAALRAIENAENAFDQASDDSPRPRVAFFNRARLAGEAGVTAARVGRPEEAKAALRGALRSLDPSSVKIRSRLLTSLAEANLDQGHIDEACRLAGESLEIASETETAQSLRGVRELRRRLDPWRHARAVRNLDEQLAVV